jgi:twitching motility two-component system response regulator PilH
MALSVLILDDATETLQLLAEFLRHRGCQVYTADNGLTGVEMAKLYRPDIVLTDVLLPGLSGFRIVDRLKNHPEYHPRVVLMSALDAPLYRDYASALGADGFLHKPFTLRQLLDSVHQLCPAAVEAELAQDDPTAEVEADAIVLS